MLQLILSIENEEERRTAEWIWLRYGPHVQMIASKILKNECDAEDAAMDAMRCVVKSIRKFVGLSELDIICLLNVYTKHAAFKIYNKNKARSKQTIELADMDLKDDESNVEDKVVSKSEYETLAKHLEAIPEKYSSPFVLRYYFGWSIREIATYLDLTEATVKKRLSRAKQKLLNMMEKTNES